MSTEPLPTLPDAAVKAAQASLASVGYGTDGYCDDDIAAALAAALPHLIDDAMIDRAAVAMGWADSPDPAAMGRIDVYQRLARVALEAALNPEGCS